MKSISILITISLLLSAVACNAQNKNSKTETVKIYGNCDMCKSTIEKAGNVKNVAKVVWDEKTKMATLTYNPIKTNQDQILKRIALAGYDSDQFLAPDDVYAKLPSCCHYERAKKTTEKPETSKPEEKEDHSKHNHSGMNKDTETTQNEVNQLNVVFNGYFALKDALVKSDGKLASVSAKELLAALKAIKMEKLSGEEHVVWMKLSKDLIFDTEHIEETNDVGHQRDHFTSLSRNMYALMKVSKQITPVYYQHCPMANSGKGANWLSKENAVKNPYYGSQMLSCGKTVETIK